MENRKRRRRKRRRGGCLGNILYLCAWVLLAAGVILFYKNKDAIVDFVQQKAVSEVPYEDVQTNSEDLTEKYYYGQLDEEQQTVYLEILQGLQDQEDEIYLHLSDAARVNDLLGYVLKDEPGIFWCDGSAKATGYDGAETYTVLKPEYSFTKEERDEKQTQIDAAVSDCLEGVSVSASDYEKILYVFEYIIRQTTYDSDADNNQNICSVFIDGRSVCAGYAKATQYLLEQLGVFCTYVTGTTTDGQSHAWNLVRCDGDYYYVDTTWGDPVFLSEESQSAQGDLDYIGYDYMCCDEEELFRTHIPDTDVTLPACESMEANYYVVNGMYYDSFDAQTALQAMNETISQKGNPTVLKYADEETYEAARETLIQEIIPRAAQNLADMYRLNEVEYRYFDEKELNKIVIYWEYE